MKPNIWVSSSQVSELLAKQLVTWPLAADNYRTLEFVRQKSFDMGGFTVKVQFNPSRIISSGAKVDRQSIQERKCFLCNDNLPVEQERLPFGFHYLVLCNPYPIFPEHFTIASRLHTEQLILPHLDDFLELTRRICDFTIFYNGPKCGASAPDHLHFQAGNQSHMPMDNELFAKLSRENCLISEGENAKIFLLTGYLRNGFVLQSRTQEAASSLFRKIYQILEIKPGDTEPMMNLFGYYKDGQWTLVIIPRRQHRPWQYNAEGIQHLLSSPGAADIGGLFITPLEEDFEKMTPELLSDIYKQVCFSDSEIKERALAITSEKN